MVQSKSQGFLQVFSTKATPMINNKPMIFFGPQVILPWCHQHKRPWIQRLPRENEVRSQYESGIGMLIYQHLLFPKWPSCVGKIIPASWSIRASASRASNHPRKTEYCCSYGSEIPGLIHALHCIALHSSIYYIYTYGGFLKLGTSKSSKLETFSIETHGDLGIHHFKNPL